MKLTIMQQRIAAVAIIAGSVLLSGTLMLDWGSPQGSGSPQASAIEINTDLGTLLSELDLKRAEITRHE